MTKINPSKQLPRRAENLSGQQFGRLTVLAYVGRAEFGGQFWRCRCDCGGEKTALAVNLKAGRTLSCGCLKRDMVVARNRVGASVPPGVAGSPEYNAWIAMKQRCSNPKHPNYPNYGGRSIGMCDRWAGSFENFLADVGLRPSAKHSIDRIDNERGYEPGNVRWATTEQQQRNRRGNRLITHAGETLILTAWAERVGLNKKTLADRLDRGWLVSDALTRPCQPRRRKKEIAR